MIFKLLEDHYLWSYWGIIVQESWSHRSSFLGCSSFQFWLSIKANQLSPSEISFECICSSINLAYCITVISPNWITLPPMCLPSLNTKSKSFKFSGIKSDSFIISNFLNDRMRMCFASVLWETFVLSKQSIQLTRRTLSWLQVGSVLSPLFQKILLIKLKLSLSTLNDHQWILLNLQLSSFLLQSGVALSGGESQKHNNHHQIESITCLLDWIIIQEIHISLILFPYGIFPSMHVNQTDNLLICKKLFLFYKMKLHCIQLKN